jgi:hypothetical protein
MKHEEKKKYALENAKNDGRWLECCPNDLCDDELILAALTEYPLGIDYIMAEGFESYFEKPSKELTDKSSEKKLSIQFPRRHSVSKAQYERYVAYAVDKCGLVIFFVPKEFHTEEIIETVIRNNPIALLYVLEKNDNPPLSTNAVKYILENRTMFHPSKFCIEEIVEMAIKNNSTVLEDILRENYEFIDFLPSKFYTDRNIKIIIETHSSALQYILEKNNTTFHFTNIQKIVEMSIT